MNQKAGQTSWKCRPALMLMWVFLLAYAGLLARSAPVVMHWLFPHALEIEAPAVPAPAAAESVKRTLTFVTYNVLDDLIAVNRRMPVLFGILRDSHADVIALQEFDTWTRDLLSREPWAAGYYQVNGAEECNGQAILSRFPLDKAVCYPLPGRQGRTVLIATLNLGGRTMAVATSHMESDLEGGPVRARQLDLIFGKLAGADDAVFLGDLNCGDGEKENSHVPAAYADLWLTLKPKEPGYTWDNEKSDMAGKSNDRFPGEPSRRLDRIFLRSSAWQPKDVRIIGDEPVVGGRKDLFPSDHFGLLGVAGLR